MKKGTVLDALKKASKGLIFTSDTEAPFEPFTWPAQDKLTKTDVLKQAGADKGTAVESMELGTFFRAVSSEDKAKFQALTQVLLEQLSGIKVYKLGDEAEKQVYIVGKAQDGQWAGLKTTVVET